MGKPASLEQTRMVPVLVYPALTQEPAKQLSFSPPLLQCCCLGSYEGEELLSVSSLQCGKWDATGAARAAGLFFLVMRWDARRAWRTAGDAAAAPSLLPGLQKVPEVAVRQVARSPQSDDHISKSGKKSFSVTTTRCLQITVWTSLSCTNELFGVCYVCWQRVFLVGLLVSNLLSLCWLH